MESLTEPRRGSQRTMWTAVLQLWELEVVDEGCASRWITKDPTLTFTTTSKAAAAEHSRTGSSSGARITIILNR